jgi:Skp family chaperone for outer membrane proteins
MYWYCFLYGHIKGYMFMKKLSALHLVLLLASCSKILIGMDIGGQDLSKSILKRPVAPTEEPQLPVFDRPVGILFSSALKLDALMRSIEYFESQENWKKKNSEFDERQTLLHTEMISLRQEKKPSLETKSKLNALSTDFEKITKERELFSNEGSKVYSLVTKKIEALTYFIAKSLGSYAVLHPDHAIYFDPQYDITDLTISLLNWHYVQSKKQ